ncbi:MAG TPA: ornithine--oxo-acid transaminase [Candidatus Baltobacteraceae bacterium]|jgi:ornithine--oxo-acid transaminase|nr:ornithine--oxo-acid transaminase [Candidatus Baltobacteraceae bacterium]
MTDFCSKRVSETARNFIEAERRFGAHTYHPLDVVVARGQGVWLEDVDGRRYLDCISAYSALNQGHCHPRIREALIAQADRVSLTSRALYNDQLGPLLEKLVAYCGAEMALLVNTGGEAVETAIKLVRRWGYRVKGIPKDRARIVVAANNFHGRSTTAISASSVPQYRADFGPFTPGFDLVPFGDFGALEAVFGPETCAFMIEPIQGEGGVHVPPAGYLEAAAALCRARNVLFVAEEVQTGFGRTGDRFAVDHHGIVPDLFVVGKALGGGYYPVAGVLGSRALLKLFGPGDHGSTFGGNPLACAVASASLDVIVEERLAERARERGAQIISALRAIGSPLIREVRGRGLLIGVELTTPARPVAEALLNEGIVAKETHDLVLRIAPPCVIEPGEAALIAPALERALARAAEGAR